MKNKASKGKRKRKRKGKGKGKGKPKILSGSVQPTPTDDQASPSNISLLPDHESSPREGDEINEHNTSPSEYQAPSRTHSLDDVSSLDDVRKEKQPMQCHDNSYEDEDDDSVIFTDDQDGSSVDSSCQDDDDFRFTVVPSDLTSLPLLNDELVSPSTLSAIPDYGSSPRTTAPDDVEHHSTLPPDPRPARNYARALMADQQPLPPQASHHTANIAGANGTTTIARDLPSVESLEITTALDDVDHPSILPPNLRPGRNYAHALMADQRPLPPAARQRKANVAGPSGTNNIAHDLPSVKFLEILDHSFKNQGSFSLIKLHAAQVIPIGADFEKEEVPKIKEMCEPHVGYLKSVQNIRGFMEKYKLVRPVEIIWGKMAIQIATAQGRLLAQAMVAVIWECHSEKRSWNGTFNIEHIRIIEPWKSEEFMIILSDPVELEGNELLQAIANDLHKAAGILRSLYKAAVYPVYFLEFIENLEQATAESLANEETFMIFLSYHPAIMPSTCRNIFICKLMKSRSKWSFMKEKWPAHPDDWKTILTSEIGREKSYKEIRSKMSQEELKRDKTYEDIIDVLNSVYYHTDNYDNTIRDLIRFMRNVLEHGKGHDNRISHGYELELYLAKMFNRFLPVTLRTMLMSRDMDKFAGEDWSSYKICKRDKWDPA